MIPEVTLHINGKKLSVWTNVTIRKSIEQFADEFDLELSTDRINNAGYTETIASFTSQASVFGAAGALLNSDGAVNQDDLVQVRIGTELVLTGYVDNIDLDYDEKSASLRVGGLSKTGDLVDSSAIYKTGQWQKVAAPNIVADICQPFGIEVLAIGNVGALFDKFTLEPGERCYEAIGRALSMRQLTAISQADGSLVIYNGDRPNSGASIEMGTNGNVLRCTMNRNRRNIHNRYIFKGQTASSDDYHSEKSTQLEGVVEDTSVKRHRPLIVLARKQKSTEDLGKRAIWERNVRAGRGERFRYTVPGWINNIGKLWETNTLVTVRDEFSKVSGDMLVSTLEFSLSDRLVTMIEVVPPGTFDPLDASVKKKTKL